MKDKIGQEIKPGAYLVYSCLLSKYTPQGRLLARGPALRIGRVWEILEQGYIVVQGAEEEWTSSQPELLLHPERTIVLQDVPEPYKKLLGRTKR